MTLPRTMIGLFPAEGEVTVVDSLTGEEHTAFMSGPRVVSGLGALYRTHGLDVNDELLVTRLAEGRFGVTPVVRVVTTEEPDAEASGADDDGPRGDGDQAVGAEAAQLAADGPGAPESADAARQEAHAADASVGRQPGAASEATVTGAPPADERTSLDPRLAVHRAETALSELESEGLGQRPTRATAGPVSGAGSVSDGAEAEAERSSGPYAEGGPEQASLWDSGGSGDSAGSGGSAGPEPSVDLASAAGQGAPVAASTPAPTAARGARVPAYESDEDHAAALAAVALSSRLRRVFTRLGYRIEPLAGGVHFLHADLGRRRYKVLVQLLRSGERLDWAGLLSHRRNSPANYLAVVGDRSDLVRLSNPADLARATLWSWEALGRLEELHHTVPVTPLDLESHFARDGLFEQGLKRFEADVAARVAQRGAASEVLTRLARNRAPSVFLLEELAQDVNLSRDAVLRILDSFAEAPMHLVAKVDSGEFLLRQPVDAALASLASYAESLRQRLPVGRREVITGLDDPELGEGLLDEVPATGGEARASEAQGEVAGELPAER